MSHDELRHELRSLLGAARALVETHRIAGASGLPLEAPPPWPPQVDDLLVGFVAPLAPPAARPASPPAPAPQASPPTPLHVRGEGSAETATSQELVASVPTPPPTPAPAPQEEASAASAVGPAGDVSMPAPLPLSAQSERGPGGEAEAVAAGEPATLAALVTPLIEAAPAEAASLFADEPTQGYFPGLGDGLDAQRPRPAAGLPANLPPARTEAAHRHLEVLAQRISQCTACELHTSRTRTVFARGNPDAEVCFVGEAPGLSEDEQGLPFVSPAGQLLDRMIAAMGLRQDEVYITTLCRCRPPGDRAPTAEEMATCMPFLREQLAVTRPRVIVALGATATKGLLQTSLGIRALRGTWKLYRTTPLMPTYHPAYLLRETEAGRLDAKREVWKDLQAVLERMGRSLPPRGKS